MSQVDSAADQVQITDLPEEMVSDAVALWHETGLTRPWNDPHEDCRRALAGNDSTVLAALGPQRELLGTVMLGQDGHRGWIYYTAVQTPLQRTGVGRRLLSAAEDWLRERGVPKLMLMVRQENAEVREFYRRLGYTDQDTVVLGRWLEPRSSAGR